MPAPQKRTAKGEQSKSQPQTATVMQNRAAVTGPGATGRASDLVVTQLEEQIISGELADGAPLPAERDLMERFGTSRTVVREAITALTSRGLIENRPRFRPVVRKPEYGAAIGAMNGVIQHMLSGTAGVKNLYDSRIFIERALAREAATSARKPDIDALREALHENESAIEDSGRFYLTDVAFHGVLYGIPKNPIFPAIHEAYVSWLSPYWTKMIESRERNLINFQSHKEIFEAIADRDPDGAEQALKNHLNAAWEYVRVTFKSDEI